MFNTVFIAKIPKTIEGNLYCKERNDEISSCKSKKVKKQKFYSWALLEHVAKSLGFSPCDLRFEKLDCGKWKCDKFNFSISHSGEFVAIVISKDKIGLDLQEDVSLPCDAFANKILTNSELNNFNSLRDNDKHSFLLEKWTQKESVYKMLENTNLKLSEINCSDFEISTSKLVFDGKIFYLSITKKTIETIIIEL